MALDTSHYKHTCQLVLNLDESIRFVGKMENRRLLAFVRREDASPLLDDELGNLAHHQAAIKVSMEEMFDESLGLTNWMITAKEKVKLITFFLDEGLLILSTEPESDHDEIIKKIQNLNMKL